MTAGDFIRELWKHVPFVILCGVIAVIIEEVIRYLFRRTRKR